MINERQFWNDGQMIFTLKRLYEIAGGEGEAWDAYFDPDGMDINVRHLFENAVQPAARTVAVMLQAFLRRMETRVTNSGVSICL